MTAVSLRAESERLGGFYVPRFEVKASGGSLPEGVVRDVLQVTYKDSIKEIDSFEITVNNWDPSTRTFRYVGSETSANPTGADAARYQLFEPCARELELAMGYGSSLTTMIRATATTLEPNFPGSGAPTLNVRALNVLHKLRKRKHQRHWMNKRDSEIATEVGRDLPLPLEVNPNARSSEVPYEYVAQTDQYDIDFLLLRARTAGYVLYVDQRRPIGQRRGEEFLYFGPSNARHQALRAVTYELEWGKSLMDFKPTLATAQQVRRVEVRGWDRAANRAIRASVDLNHRGITCNRDLLPILTRADCEPREDVVVNEPMFTRDQAERRALALLTDKLKEMVTAQGTTIGLPDLRAGQRVSIVGLGARFSGTYFLTETTHTINDSGYLTRFSARREQAATGGTP